MAARVMCFSGIHDRYLIAAGWITHVAQRAEFEQEATASNQSVQSKEHLAHLGGPCGAGHMRHNPLHWYEEHLSETHEAFQASFPSPAQQFMG